MSAAAQCWSLSSWNSRTVRLSVSAQDARGSAAGLVIPPLLGAMTARYPGASHPEFPCDRNLTNDQSTMYGREASVPPALR